MCRQQYISMLLWTFGLKEDFVKGEALPLPIFAPPWIHPLEYLAEDTTRTVIGKRFLPNGPFSAFFNDFEILNGPFLINLHRLLWAMGLWRVAPYLPYHCQNGSIPSKAFCLWSSLWLLALPWIHPRVDLIKSLNTYVGHENFIPTKFHKHPSSGSVHVVKADYVYIPIYIHALGQTPPPPFLHLNKYINKSCQKTTTLAGRQQSLNRSTF